MLAAVDISPVQSFVTALVERDFSGLEHTLAQDVRFRSLTPPGFRERATSVEARELIQTWFEDTDIFDVEYSSIEAVGECVHAGYRVRVREDGVWYVCEQHAFAHTSGGVIDTLDLLCSGFRRMPAITGAIDYRREPDEF